MDTPRSADQHHGLVIMQQRAHALGGDMRVRRSPDGGTRVRVSIPLRRAKQGVEGATPLTNQMQ
jgi:nitrate/nitrite-specific signal transduction histidine kinase